MVVAAPVPVVRALPIGVGARVPCVDVPAFWPLIVIRLESKLFGSEFNICMHGFALEGRSHNLCEI